jgi:pimeloyl-ACP methyl ester carboxylesterase
MHCDRIAAVGFESVRRVAVTLCALVAGLAAPGLARATEVSVRMDDGVPIFASLLEPSGTPPTGGWPGVMMFHGLGGSHTDLLPIAQSYVAKGYAVFVPDARGHAHSGGFVSLDGPREVADVRTEFQWFAGLPEVSDTQIGAWGISLGGGAAWNSVIAGVRFRAMETFETWSDLYQALFPQNFGKSGAIYAFAQSVPSDRIDPALRKYVPQLISSENLPAVRPLLGARSSLQLMSTVTTPSFLFQGRRDFAFDIDQAAAAYRRLAGPKRLYIGDFGHSPSKFPGPDLAHIIELSTRWYDRFLKEEPNGVDKEKPVQVASDPWRAATGYAGVPKVNRVTFVRSGSHSLSAKGKAVYTFPPLKRTIEQFGAPVLSLTAKGAADWPHVVAVLTAGDTVLSEGGTVTPAGQKSWSLNLKLISDANLLKKGTRLKLTVGATSTVQNIANLLYLKTVPDDARLKLGAVKLTIPVLPKPISR